MSLIVAAASEIPSVVTGRVGQRGAAHAQPPVALRLIRENGPIAAPSANGSQRGVPSR